MQVVTGLIATIVATAAVVMDRFVDFGGTYVAGKAMGVARDDAAIGESVGVVIEGIVDVEAGGSITAGDLVTSDTNGKAIKLTLTAVTDAGKICGRALTTATSGSLVKIQLGA